MESAARLVPALIRPAVLAPWAVALALTGCATMPDVVKAPPPERSPRSTPEPKASPPAGVQTGMASWYGTAHHGRRTASGEVFDMHALTAAHPSLPLGTRVLVTNTRNGRSIEVRINDRGPFVRGRIIDLSYAAAQRLGAVTEGAFPVTLRTVSVPTDAPAPTPASEKDRRGRALDEKIEGAWTAPS